VLPVEIKSNAQSSCSFVDAVPWNQHDPHNTRRSRGKMQVLGQRDPILFGAARSECAVGQPACGNDCVVTGSMKPSTEAAQNLLADYLSLETTLVTEAHH
jgi:hypothetical protein